MSDDPDADMLAAEYAMGVMSADEAKLSADRRLSDSVFNDLVCAWERRLMPLTALVPAVQPPAGLRARIEAAMPLPTAARPESAKRTSRWELQFWRGMTAASLALACGLAVVLWNRPAPPAQVAVLLPPGDNFGGFSVESVSGGGLVLAPLRQPTVPAGRDLQLWTLQQGASAPRSLGLLPTGGTALVAGSVPTGDVQLLVSLEPSGGSPTGLPTGPVVLAAPLHRP